MKKEFEEFIDLVEKNVDRCPWIKTVSLEDYKKKLSEETNEVLQAIDSKNYQNLKEELGDLFWNVAVMAYLAEKEGYFKAEEIIKSINEKMKRRKPWLLGEKKELVREEARKIWFEAKEKEKIKNESNRRA